MNASGKLEKSSLVKVKETRYIGGMIGTEYVATMTSSKDYVAH